MQGLIAYYYDAVQSGKEYRRNKFKGLPALQTTVHHPAPTATELLFIQTLISFERACPQAVTRHGGGLKRNDLKVLTWLEGVRHEQFKSVDVGPY